jgi:hypothetical protein
VCSADIGKVNPFAAKQEGARSCEEIAIKRRRKPVPESEESVITRITHVKSVAAEPPPERIRLLNVIFKKVRRDIRHKFMNRWAARRNDPNNRRAKIRLRLFLRSDGVG